jgi:hypothetical protein
MQTFVDKLRSAGREIAAENGPLEFFALFQREDSEKWDVLVAAPWMRDRVKALRIVSEKLQQRLSPDELIQLARVVILEHQNAAYQQFVKSHEVTGKAIQLKNESIFGQDIRNAYLLTSGSLG